MRLTTAVLVLALLGCSTPYQKSGWSGGYTDEQIGEGKFLVTFRGNGFTGSETVQSYAIRRAKEVCAENGYPKWDIGNINDSTSVTRGPSNTTCSRRGYSVDCYTNDNETSKASTRLVVQCLR